MKYSRRKFMSVSAKGATGALFLSGCDTVTVRPDLRLPSAPKGVDYSVKYSDDEKSIVLSWAPHDFTDITGEQSEIHIKGYSIYYAGEKKPIKSLTKKTTFIDSDGPDGKGFKDGKSYSYEITVTDGNDNESPRTLVEVTVYPPSPIYRVKSSTVNSGPKINYPVVEKMIFEGVKAFTKKDSVSSAFKQLFPNITRSKKIVLKINCLAGATAGGLCTHPEIVQAVLAGIGKITIEGKKYPLKNVTVLDDRSKKHLANAGFVLKNGADDYRILIAEQKKEKDSFGNRNWSKKKISIVNSKQRMALAVEEADYIVNLPVLKDHSFAGITFSLKNMYGLIDRPFDMHDHKDDSGYGSMCDPYVGELYKLFKDKIVVTIGDAIFGASQGGPATKPNFLGQQILISNDPVALDMVALSLINEDRRKNGMREIATTVDVENGRQYADARHIISAAKVHKVGVTNSKIIEVKL